MTVYQKIIKINDIDQLVFCKPPRDGSDSTGLIQSPEICYTQAAASLLLGGQAIRAYIQMGESKPEYVYTKEIPAFIPIGAALKEPNNPEKQGSVDPKDYYLDPEGAPIHKSVYKKLLTPQIARLIVRNFMLEGIDLNSSNYSADGTIFDFDSMLIVYQMQRKITQYKPVDGSPFDKHNHDLLQKFKHIFRISADRLKQFPFFPSEECPDEWISCSFPKFQGYCLENQEAFKIYQSHIFKAFVEFAALTPEQIKTVFLQDKHLAASPLLEDLVKHIFNERIVPLKTALADPDITKMLAARDQAEKENIYPESAKNLEPKVIKPVPIAQELKTEARPEARVYLSDKEVAPLLRTAGGWKPKFRSLVVEPKTPESTPSPIPEDGATSARSITISPFSEN